jgi:flagellar biosynthetic protein FliO
MGGSGSELPGVGGSLAFSLISLGLVCVVAFAVLRWLGRKGVGRSSGRIRVLGQCYLEPHRTVYLVEAAERCFLLGVGDGPISLIAEVDRAAVATVTSEGQGARNGLATVLAKVVGRRAP